MIKLIHSGSLQQKAKMQNQSFFSNKQQRMIKVFYHHCFMNELVRQNDAPYFDAGDNTLTVLFFSEKAKKHESKFLQ